MRPYPHLIRHLLIILVVLSAWTPALAQYSGAFEGFSFQGYLTDDTDVPIDGTRNITAVLYDDPTEGSVVWQRTYLSHPVTDGLFHLILSDGTPFLDGVSFDIPMWLEIKVSGEAIAPRSVLTSVPSALSLRNMRVIAGTQPSILGGYVGNWKGTLVEGATISGGGSDSAPGSNYVEDNFGTIGGGAGNTAAFYATIAGGYSNTSEGSYSTVSGGYDNSAEGQYSSIAGGRANNTQADYSSIVGGWSNYTDGAYSIVAGGYDNDALGDYSAIVGGFGHEAGGYASFVGGGINNRAGAQYSFVAGDRARTRSAGESGLQNGDEGTFVWSDRSVTVSDFTSTGPNQFLIQAVGGVGIGTNAPGAQLHIGKPAAGKQGMLIEATNNDKAYLYFVENTSLTFDTYRGSDSRRLPIALQPNGGNVGIGTTTPSEKLQVNGNVLANNVAVPSDARYKRDVTPLANSMDRIAALRGVSYSFDREAHPDKNFDSGTHMGLIAQEVREVFPELTKESESGYLSVNYIELIPALIEAVKELQQRVNTLEASQGTK